MKLIQISNLEYFSIKKTTTDMCGFFEFIVDNKWPMCIDIHLVDDSDDMANGFYAVFKRPGLQERKVYFPPKSASKQETEKANDNFEDAIVQELVSIFNKEVKT